MTRILSSITIISLVVVGAAAIGGILVGLTVSNKSIEDLIWILNYK